MGSPNMLSKSSRSSSFKPKGSSRRKRWCKDSGPMVVKPPSATNLVMGQVKILKRGEKLDPSSPSKELQSNGGCDMAVKEDYFTIENERFVVDDDDPPVLCFTGRLGPDPSSLPIPRFTSLWKKKKGVSSCSCSSEGIGHVATKDPRHLLGLDILS
eukprot:TRINITY_DN1856_c0_g1_i2.p1 TRINITY_DN1856_c0_g1~~TRINITY_DN1856_c0_g1_i2.p1  ORF type:complete len:156 (+),score=25.39 TRINITY_DN1856_c0_g1_i2:246-713(+)